MITSLGIHTSKSAVCFAVVRSNRGLVSLDSLEEHVFENPAEETKNRLFASQLIENIYAKHKEGKKLRVCYGLPQDLVSCFSLQLPFREKFKILKILPFEIESNTLFHSEKPLFDARMCAKIGRRESRIMCFAAPKSTVEDFLKSQIELKKISPFLLSCDGAGLANLIESNKDLYKPQNAKDFSLYVYLGAQNSRALFYKDGFLSDIFLLDWSVQPIVKKMEKLYHLTRKKSWEEFFEKSFVLTASKDRNKEQIFFSNMIKKESSALLNKLRLLKISLEADQKAAIKDMAVFGPGSRIKNLSVFLSEELSIRVSKLKSYSAFLEKETVRQPLADVALGLALEGLKPPPWQGLNFLHSFKKKTVSLFPQKQRNNIAAALIAFAVIGAWAFVRKQQSAKTLNKAQSVFMDYGKSVALLEKKQVNVSAVRSFLKKRAKKLSSDKLLKKELNQEGAMDRLQSLAVALNVSEQWELGIERLKILPQRVEIKGHVSPLFAEQLKARLTGWAKGPVTEGLIDDLKEKGAVSAKPNSQKPASGKPAKEGALSGAKAQAGALIDKGQALKGSALNPSISQGLPQGKPPSALKSKESKNSAAGGKTALKGLSQKNRRASALAENLKTGAPAAQEKGQEDSPSLQEELSSADSLPFSYSFDI